MLSRACTTLATTSTRRSRTALAAQRTVRAKTGVRKLSTAVTNPKVFFDVSIDGKDAGRITFEVRSHFSDFSTHRARFNAVGQNLLFPTLRLSFSAPILQIPVIGQETR